MTAPSLWHIKWPLTLIFNQTGVEISSSTYSSNCEKIKHFTAVTPGIGISVLCLTFIWNIILYYRHWHTSRKCNTSHHTLNTTFTHISRKCDSSHHKLNTSHWLASCKCNTSHCKLNTTVMHASRKCNTSHRKLNTTNHARLTQM